MSWVRPMLVREDPYEFFDEAPVLAVVKEPRAPADPATEPPR